MYDYLTKEELLEERALILKALRKATMAKEYRIGKQSKVNQDIAALENRLKSITEALRRLDGTGGPILQPGRPAR